jgi:hypothetical protein
VYPAFAAQAVMAVDPTLAPVPEPLGQAVHVEAPAESENVAKAQDVHAVPHDASAS